jgi:hypothetical protein
VSKLDPLKDWICEELRADPAIRSLRLQEMAIELGYAGGKTIFDDFVREASPRFQVRRTFQRTIYRPGELVQCDLWEPRDPVPVGHGQTLRGWVVTAEAVLVAGDRQRVGLLQAGAGHPLPEVTLATVRRRIRDWAGREGYTLERGYVAETRTVERHPSNRKDFRELKGVPARDRRTRQEYGLAVRLTTDAETARRRLRRHQRG